MPGMRMIEVAGSSIEYAWFGPEVDHARKPPVVFLHHGFGCVADWKGFPQRVAEASGHPALAYSRRGCGASSPPAQPRQETFLDEEARFLPLLLDALGIGRCHLYGHSDGATIALLFAAACADRALSAVVEAPHVFAEQVTLDGVAALAGRFETDPALRRKLARHHRDPVAAFEGWSRPWSLPQFRSWTIVEELDKLDLPLLVIQGAADPYGTMEHARLIARHARRPPAILELPATGHNPHVEAEELTANRVTAFLRGVENDSGRAL